MPGNLLLPRCHVVRCVIALLLFLPLSRPLFFVLLPISTLVLMSIFTPTMLVWRSSCPNFSIRGPRPWRQKTKNTLAVLPPAVPPPPVVSVLLGLKPHCCYYRSLLPGSCTAVALSVVFPSLVRCFSLSRNVAFGMKLFWSEDPFGEYNASEYGASINTQFVSLFFLDVDKGVEVRNRSPSFGLWRLNFRRAR